MEVQYKSHNGQFVVSLDVKDQAGLFEAIADFQEVFEDGKVVINGKEVQSEHVQLRVRTVDDNKYFEKVYTGPDRELWGFKLPYGQNKKGGGLFPKRRITDEERATVKDGGGGWRKFLGDGSKPQAQQQPKGEGAPF